MFKILLKRRKFEFDLIVGIILFLAIIAIGTTIAAGNSFPYEAFLLLDLGTIFIATSAFAMTKMSNEFNYAIGMGKTRKSFLLNYTLITIIYTLFYICVIGITAIIFGYIRDIFSINDEINVTIFEIMFHPVIIMLFVLFILAIQFCLFVAKMTIPQWLYTIWLAIYIALSVGARKIDADGIVKNIFIDITEKPLENISIIVGFTVVLLVIVSLLWKKILKLKVVV